MELSFLYVETPEGPLFVNIYQIVKVDNISDVSISLHLSDGHAVHVLGGPATEKLFALLAERSMVIDGRPFLEVMAELSAEDKSHLPKIVPIRPEDE